MSSKDGWLATRRIASPPPKPLIPTMPTRMLMVVSFWLLGKRKPPEPGAAGVQERGPRPLRRMGPTVRQPPRGGTLIDTQPEEPPHGCSGVGVDHKGSGS